MNIISKKESIYNSNKLKSEFCNLSRNKNMFDGFSVKAVGFKSIPPKSSYPFKIQSEKYLFKTDNISVEYDYQLIYITRGTGIFKVGSSEIIQICAGHFFLILPEQQYFHCPNQEIGWDEYSVEFYSDTFENNIKSFTIKDQIVNIGLNVELVDLFRRAIEVLKVEDSHFHEHLQGIVLHIIGLTITEFQRGNKTNVYSLQIVEKAKIVMRENIFASLSPVELALKLEMNYVTFRKLFKETTGVAPAKYLMTLKMQKAREILANSSLSINKISNDLGFDSPDSFNKAFKKNTGQTGTKYRLSCRRTSG